MATLNAATRYETDYQFTMYVAFASTETSCTPICYDALDALVQLYIYWDTAGTPCDYVNDTCDIYYQWKSRWMVRKCNFEA